LSSFEYTEGFILSAQTTKLIGEDVIINDAMVIATAAMKDYLTISGYGLLLLFASNQATVLINSPYPPLGMAAISFVGLSSYLIFVGIYSSAASVAQDIKLHQSIRNSVERQLDLLHNIGNAEMEKEIVKKGFEYF
jgi:hypothetical protein